MSNPQQSPFDLRFIVVMALVFFGWIGWQSYLAKKYPDYYKTKSQTAAQSQDEKTNAASVSNSNNEQNNVANHNAEAVPPESSAQKSSELLKETFLQYEDEVWRFNLSSRGMAIKSIELKKYKDRTGENIVLAKSEEDDLFTTSLLGRREPVQFNLSRNDAGEFVGVANVDGMKITKIIHVNSSNYTLNTKVRVENLADYFTGLNTTFSERVEPAPESSFFMPAISYQEFYINHEGTNSRNHVDEKQVLSEVYPQTKIAGYGSHYFAVAILDKSPVVPEFKVASTKTGENSTSGAYGVLSYNLLNKTQQFNLDYVVFAGPKSFDVLKSIDADMTNLVNFGFFSSIAKAILWLMKTIFAALGNWGAAIIVLTIIVRLLVLPFNLIGYRQMKTMSKLAPEMKLIKEKYKDDKLKQNEETMKLLKESKANPLGGCLPIFLQFPIFLALYQVIGQSIELYQAPFALWIHDLSLKDPYYVLPVLMAVTMFIQQKITPSALDPAQQKVMLVLPFFFSLLMLSLPSGLTLYIFVSTLFGVIQQFYFMKEQGPQTKAA